MKDTNNVKVKFSQVSFVQKFVFSLFIVVSIILQISFVSGRANKKRTEQIHAAAQFGENAATEIQLLVNNYTNTANILKNFYLQYGGMFINDFHNVCRRLYEDNVSIGSLVIAPNGIIQNVYPPETGENDKIIGHNIIENDSEGKSMLAINTRIPTISSPRKLIIGGKEIEGFMIRNPIFAADEFVGFSIIILDYELFTNQVLERVNNEKAGYRIYLRRPDGTVLLGNNSNENFSLEKISDIVKINIDVPNDTWYLYVEPLTGWFTIKDVVPGIIFSLVVILLIIFIVYFSIMESAKRIYKYEHDSLTGLLTRSAFYRRVKKLFLENPDVSYNFIMTDVLHFKVLNSLHNTEKCNDLLKYLANCFKHDSYDGLCARFSGDQFIYVIRQSDTKEYSYFIKRVDEIVSHAPISNIIIKYGFYKDVDKTVPVNLLADRALIAAKSIGNNYGTISESFDGELSLRLQREQLLESKFEKALENKDFKVWFQPKFDVKTHKLVGCEALVRWFDSETNKYIYPSDFIYLFENDGLIYYLDKYVFETVCSYIKSWIDKGIKVAPVSINLSRSSLYKPGLIDEYVNIAKSKEVPLKYVPLELTETTAYKTGEIKEIAEQFKKAGFPIHMDDFGTGTSSLASLNILPFDVVKIDKSVVDFIGTDDGNEMLRHMIELSHYRKMEVVAEGVETQEQLDFLNALDCDIVQGYLFSPPISYEELAIKYRELERKSLI